MQLKLPGLRIIKTFIATLIALLISQYRPGLGQPFQSAIAAIICLQQNVDDSRDVGINRIIGTLLGGLCGLVYLMLVPAGSLAPWLELTLISVLTSIIIWVMAMLNKPKALVIMAIVFLAITLIPSTNEPAYMSALNRTLDTMIGVITAVVVNRADFSFREDHIK